MWSSLKARFLGADRVRATRLSLLSGHFDRLRVADGEALDAYASRIEIMAMRYVGLRTTLDDAAMVKKLLDTMSGHLRRSGGSRH